MVERRAFRFLTVACALLCPVVSFAAELAPGALAHLVEADAALLVEVRQFQSVARGWPDTELGRRWKQSWFDANFPPLQAVRGVAEQVRAATSQSLIEHVTEFFGQSATLALYLPEQRPPEGILLVQATSPEAIERGLALWNRLEPKARTTRRDREGVAYFARELPKSSDVVYYVQQGAVFALSDREDRIVACAQRLLKAAEGSLADDPQFRAIAQGIDAKTFAWAYAPARRWDRVLQRDADDTPLSKHFLQGWSTIESLQLTSNFEGGLHVELQARLMPDRLPTTWTSEATTLTGLPALCRQAPADALLIAGVRLQSAWWVEQFRSLMLAEDRDEWVRTERVLRGLLHGESPFGEIAQSLLRDCSGYLLHETVRASVQGEPRRLPWSIVLNASFPNEDRSTKLSAALENGLLFGLNGVATHLNTKDDQPLRTVETRGQLHWLTGDPLWEPSFLITPRGLLIGTSAAVVNQANAVLEMTSTSDTPFHRVAENHFDDAAVFAWANLARVRELSEYRALAVAARAVGSSGEKGVAVLELARLFDSVWIRGRYADAVLKIDIRGLTTSP